MQVIATDGETVVAAKLRNLPEKLMIFDNLDKVSYKIVGGELLTEKELQNLFDEYKINCLLL